MSKKKNKNKKRRNRSYHRKPRTYAQNKVTSPNEATQNNLEPKLTTSDTTPKQVSKETKPSKSVNKITTQRNVLGMENKLNDAVDQNLYQMPYLIPFVRFADWWNLKLRQPVASFVAKRLIAPPRRTDDSDFKLKKSSRMLLDFFDILIKVILIMIILNVFSVYTLPLTASVLTKEAPGFILQIILLVVMLLMWEEINRVLRSIVKYMDYFSNNMVTQRLADKKNPDKPTATGALEGYKVGWASGVWTKFTEKGSSKFLLYFLSGLAMSALLNIGNALDSYMGWANTSSNVQSLNLVSQRVPFLLIITTIFLAPLIEEFVFRGVIFRALLIFNEKLKPRMGYEDGWQTETNDKKILRNRKVGLVISTLFQALLFAFAHNAKTLGYGGALFLAAILLQFLYYKTGSIKTNIYAHAWSNALAVIIPILLTIK